MDLYRLAAPLLGLLEPERAHGLTLWVLTRVAPRAHGHDEPILHCHALGRDFANPLGLAAGFDKNAVAVDAMLGLGFGFVEIGTVTPRPQAGNPRPRVGFEPRRRRSEGARRGREVTRSGRYQLSNSWQSLSKRC